MIVLKFKFTVPSEAKQVFRNHTSLPILYLRFPV